MSQSLSWIESSDITDTELCDECMVYFVPGAVMGDDTQGRLCEGCLNAAFQVTELSGPELLALEDQRGQV